MKVYDVLPRGRENAVPSRYLADLCGYQSVRSLQRAIRAERDRGAVILSSSTDGGYYVPDDVEEIRQFIHTLSARVRNTERARESARAELERI